MCISRFRRVSDQPVANKPDGLAIARSDASQSRLAPLTGDDRGRPGTHAVVPDALTIRLPRRGWLGQGTGEAAAPVTRGSRRRPQLIAIVSACEFVVTAELAAPFPHKFNLTVDQFAAAGLDADHVGRNPCRYCAPFPASATTGVSSSAAGRAASRMAMMRSRSASKSGISSSDS